MSLPKNVLDAIELADTDALVRAVDGFCASREWGELGVMRLHCQAAVERGKQLWAVDEHIRYRIALEGPADLAAKTVDEGPARWTLGPLTEVAAQTHEWSELEPHLESGPARAFVAHERSIRGDSVAREAIDASILEIPVTIQPWEPGYPVAEYKSDRAEFPSPAIPRLAPVPITPAERIDDVDAIDALTGLVKPWYEQSSGRVDVAVVDGGLSEALGALGVPAALAGEMPVADALAWLGWAAASGAAHARRRGAASGRFETWWALSVLTDLEFPPDPAGFGELLAAHRWHWWSDGDDDGWRLNLAVTDPGRDRTWAVTAIDAE